MILRSPGQHVRVSAARGQAGLGRDAGPGRGAIMALADLIGLCGQAII
jgi:hypothetical protein